MRSRIAPVVTAAAVLVTTAVCASAASAGPPPRPEVRAVTCGTWRWSVKTLSDARAKKVHYRAVAKGIGFLRRVFAPSGLTADTRRVRRSPEMRAYRIHGDLLQAIREPDHDIHLVVSVPGHPRQSMIVEFPDVACSGAVSSHRKARIARARADLLADCGDIGSDGFTELDGSATITGVGFFDESHGQTGASPNGIELHPALSYSGTCEQS